MKSFVNLVSIVMLLFIAVNYGLTAVGLTFVLCVMSVMYDRRTRKNA